MQRFKIVVKGQPYDIGANNEQEAIQKAMAHSGMGSQSNSVISPMTGNAMTGDESETELMMAPGGFGGKAVNFVKQATPLGSVEYIKKGLQGTGPMTPLGAGFAAADIASFGAGSKLKGGATGAKYLGEQALAGAGGALGAEAAGAVSDNPLLRIPAAIVGAVTTGKFGGIKPNAVTKQVPKGQEAQALSRVIQEKLGIPMQTPLTSKPGDVSKAFGDIRSTLGESVESAKQAMYQTGAKSPLVTRRIAGAGYDALKDAGVPILESGLAPELSKNPEAAKAVMEALDKINSIPKDTPGPQAMEISNNVIEALKAKLAQSAKQGSPVNLKGPIMGKSISSMESSMKTLAPEGTAAASDAADSAFSKLATLHDMAFKSSKTMAQEGPRFNPRKFLFMWETMKPSEKASRFSQQEIDALNFLTEQKDPNIFMSAARKAAEAAAAGFNKLGILDLKHHPATRFKESRIPWLSKQAAIEGGKTAVRRKTQGE